MNLYITLIVIWVSFEVLISFLLRSSKIKAISFDRHSILLIWIVLIAAVTIAVFESFHFKPASNLCIYIGLSLILVGMILRIAAILSLKTRFTTNIAIQDEHALKTDGLYSKIRHPSYTGSLISFLGLGLSYGNWLSFFTIMIPISWVFIFRISLEERMLIKHFGTEYKEYVKKTKRLVPFVY
jgi:protein-S-isoprenylcysteine O-methyltransferase Ste14